MNNLKTVTKSMVVVSTIAIISILTMSVLPLGRSSAFDLGMFSKDTNIGSIDTHSLFNCFGAAITCDNDNTVNNNVSVNNGTNQPNQPLSCVQCFENANLTPDQEDRLFGGTDKTFEEVCSTITGDDANTIEITLVNAIGLTQSQAEALVDCLVQAGVLVRT